MKPSYPYALSFVSALLFSTSYACATDYQAIAEIRIKITPSIKDSDILEGAKQEQFAFQIPHQELFPSKIYPKARKNAEKGKYLDFDNLVVRYFPAEFSETDVKNARKAYRLGQVYLEWSTDDLIFRQYCNSKDGRHTLAVLKPKKNRTYYTQQRFDGQNKMVDVYSDSRYQIEYWREGGKWVVERESFKTNAYEARWLALFQLKQLGEDEPFYKEPYPFAHPSYKRFIDEQEDAEFNSEKINKASALFHSYLMLSGIFIPPLQYGLSSRSSIANESDEGAHPASDGHSYFTDGYSLSSWLEYAAFAPFLLAKPLQNNAILSLKSALMFGAFSVFKVKASGQCGGEILQDTCNNDKGSVGPQGQCGGDRCDNTELLMFRGSWLSAETKEQTGDLRGQMQFRIGDHGPGDHGQCGFQGCSGTKPPTILPVFFVNSNGDKGQSSVEKGGAHGHPHKWF